jgi:pimeloyl-ACP methyl ester carboxylesterase
MLEVIDKGQISETHSYPVLFLHGAWHGAWWWDEHFLDFFATQGFRVLAPSSRGHGSSPTGKSIRMCSIADFVSDLSSVIDSLPSPPILVGHSLGGLSSRSIWRLMMFPLRCCWLQRRLAGSCRR